MKALLATGLSRASFAGSLARLRWSLALTGARRRAWAVALPGAVLIFLAVALWGGSYRYREIPSTEEVSPQERPAGASIDRQIAKLHSEKKQLATALRWKLPRGCYIVIDQTHNRLYLKRGGKTELEAVCSAGSGMVLRESESGGRKWVFDTPRGSFRVLNKLKNPVWKKPDWAFVEEGLPIPKNPAERFEYGSLGEYALYFGDGYMIHGTLYERLLGRSVTHGCIRLGREDLRKVYEECPIGTRIFIY